MWLLGAGASASSGIPTSADMVLEFKQKLYVSHKRVPSQTVADLLCPVIRARLQDHIDSLEDLPRMGATDEYAALFEKVYPSEIDRRDYIQEKVKGAKPAYGYQALATLMRSNQVPLVWTTNFDTLTADACATRSCQPSALPGAARSPPPCGCQSTGLLLVRTWRNSRSCTDIIRSQLNLA